MPALPPTDGRCACVRGTEVGGGRSRALGLRKGVQLNALTWTRGAPRRREQAILPHPPCPSHLRMEQASPEVAAATFRRRGRRDLPSPLWQRRRGEGLGDGVRFETAGGVTPPSGQDALPLQNGRLRRLSVVRSPIRAQQAAPLQTPRLSVRFRAIPWLRPGRTVRGEPRPYVPHVFP
jgi:hypothetical protein